MDDHKDVLSDFDGDNVIRKGQVLSKKAFTRSSEAVQNSHPSKPELGFLDGESLTKKGEIGHTERLRFHTDATAIVQTVFGEEIPKLLQNTPFAESYEANEADKDKFSAKITWREASPTVESQTKNFTYREVEIQRIGAPHETEGVIYSLVVRYIEVDDHGNKKYGNEFILSMDQPSKVQSGDPDQYQVVSHVKGASVWEYTHDESSYDSKSVHLNAEGKPHLKPNAHIAEHITDRNDVLAGRKDVHVIDTFKQWVNQMPGMKTKPTSQ